MPIYEFACEPCDHRFETLVRNGDEPACPKCGKSRGLVKLLSVPAAHTSGGDLPMCEPPSGTCGLPQCGSGGCQMM
jgi:putative FmdB family regulatory protein